MTLQEPQNQTLQLPIGDRWRLVQALLSSIQQEAFLVNLPTTDTNSVTDLNPWTQSLIGIVHLGAEDSTASYVDYLEEKYG